MKSTFISFFLVVLAGCNAHDVSVSAWTDGKEIGEKTYCFVAGARDITPTDLEFKEFSVYARRGLVAQGYTEAAIDKAALLVSLAYGMNGPYAAPYAYMVDLTGPKAVLVSDAEAATSAGVSVASGSHLGHEPTFVGGYYYGSYYDGYYATQYVRFLHMAAYDNKGGKRGDQRWRVDAISAGTENDLRRIMPFLMAGAYPRIGQDTGRQIDMVIYGKTPAYKLIIGQ